MTKLQQYKTVKGVIRSGVLDRVNVNREITTDSSGKSSGKYTPPSLRLFSMFSSTGNENRNK